MIPDQYVWLIWSILFLIPWIIIFILIPRFRKRMWWTSVFTMPFGLTEPLFVPNYWNPPTLFHLAQKTGFDIESLIFCFGIGGIAVVFYNLLTGQKSIEMPHDEQMSPRHRFHRVVLFLPFLIFGVLIIFPWNAIYPGIIAMVIGGMATVWCRPDLFRKTVVGGTIFVIYYFIFLIGLDFSSPNFISRYWNHKNLTGIHLFGIPLEELLFALGFGMYWSSVYEHISWKQLRREYAH